MVFREVTLALAIDPVCALFNMECGSCVSPHDCLHLKNFRDVEFTLCNNIQLRRIRKKTAMIDESCSCSILLIDDQPYAQDFIGHCLEGCSDVALRYDSRAECAVELAREEREGEGLMSFV